MATLILQLWSQLEQFLVVNHAWETRLVKRAEICN